MFRSILSILAIIIGLTVVNASSGKKFGLPPLGNVPAISEIKKPVPDGRPIKVVLTCLVPGSSEKAILEIAKSLSKAENN